MQLGLVMPETFQIECHREDLDLDPSTLSSIAREALAIVSGQLEIDASELEPTRVIVGTGVSHVVDRTITIAPRPAGHGYTPYDWFELLLSHELTHLLVRDAWGTPPVLLWEGLSVHLGDDRVRARLFETSYHAHCRALAELERLLPISPLLRASTYYRRRPDFRVDLQAGSLCGFLLDSRGARRVAAFVHASRPPYEPAIIDALAREHLGTDLTGLEAEWCRFLHRQVACDMSLVERARARSFGSEPDGAARCDHCFARVGDCSHRAE